MVAKREECPIAQRYMSELRLNEAHSGKVKLEQQILIYVVNTVGTADEKCPNRL